MTPYTAEVRRDEELAITLADVAAAGGIPTPRVIPTQLGNAIYVDGELAFVLLEFVEGATHQRLLTAQQMTQAGATLGRIHRLFRDLDFGLPSATPGWLAVSLEQKQEELAGYIRHIKALPAHTHFDRIALQLLSQRRRQLEQIPSLIRVVGELKDQVIHNDYSIKNLLFRGPELAAVVDFCPPHPFLSAYELGRIAFAPESLAEVGWIDRALALIRAYRDEADADSHEMLYCPHAWLLQLLRSNYGLRQHYFAPTELQAELDEFWLMRANATTLLIENLEELTARLSAL